jgi:hypothetical protein
MSARARYATVEEAVEIAWATAVYRQPLIPIGVKLSAYNFVNDRMFAISQGRP